MKLDSASADLVIATVSACLPPGVRIKRRRTSLIVKAKPARFEWASSSSPVFEDLSPGIDQTARVSRVLHDVIAEASSVLSGQGMAWPGLEVGAVVIDIHDSDGQLTARATDGAGRFVEFAAITVPRPTLAEQAAAATAAALRIDLAAQKSEVDVLVLWLLRIGIDHSGELELTRPWDVAVRALVVTDLRRGGRLVETIDTVQVDTELSGRSYEDAACQQLLASSELTELDWIRTGPLRARDVAEYLIRSGEWTMRRRPLRAGGRLYRSVQHQHGQLRRRLAHTYDGDIEPLSDAEAALAVVGHALNVVRPRRVGVRSDGSESPLQPHDCGSLAAAVSVAVGEIQARVAVSSANSNPAW